MTLKVTSN